MKGPLISAASVVVDCDPKMMSSTTTTTTSTSSSSSSRSNGIYGNPIDMSMGNPFRAIEHVTEQIAKRSRRRVHQAQSPPAPPASSTTHLQTPKKVVVSASAHARRHERFEKTPMLISVAGYVSYIFLFVVGYVREFIWGMGPLGAAKPITESDRCGYTPLFASFESFYTRNIYRRLKDVFNRPICSTPGPRVSLVNRHSDDHFWTWKMDPTSKQADCINLASYNYLGFAENTGPCTEAAIAKVSERGLSSGSNRHELGTLAVQKELEETVAKFLGVEDAVTVGMGFATNSLNLPTLMHKGCLVLSDEKNHASIILGLRLSGATVMVFKHNSVENLERILRKAIVHGHPRTRRPWKKIFIVVEGVYSMEGSIVRLPEMVALKKKYGAYIYLDEAHSVGAMGPRGRGVIDYFGLDPKEIDIMMGTFTKSFGSAGGYIAGSRRLVSYLRVNSQAMAYPASMSPPVAQQIIGSMNAIMSTEDGLERIRRLARNARYFRQRLQQMGCIVHGHDDSPVVPLMLFVPAKIPAMVKGLLERNIASIGVGFPATNMTEERARFCISASHTKEILDEALDAIDQVADNIHIKYSKRNKYQRAEIVY